MQKIILTAGASSGFGQIIARDLARAGHVSYASMRGTIGHNQAAVADSALFASEHGVDLRTVDLDVSDDASIARAIDSIIAQHGRIDAVVHNAGHMVWGPIEAFTADQLAALYDVNILGAQRVNRAVLPRMRAAGSGLLVWISSSSVAGGVPPFLGPYFAAKAGMDALAVCSAKELAPFGIETSIIVPGAYTTGTNHFAHAGAPVDGAVEADYAKRYAPGFADDIKAALAAMVPPTADPAGIGRAATDLLAIPHWHRPLRVRLDPASDGAAVGFAVIDRVRAEFLSRIGHADLLHPMIGA